MGRWNLWLFLVAEPEIEKSIACLILASVPEIETKIGTFYRKLIH